MNVYPRDVEEPLYRHPKVKEVVDYCHTRMARYKVPKFVEFRRELPRSLVGKVLGRRLLEEEDIRVAVRFTFGSSKISRA